MDENEPESVLVHPNIRIRNVDPSVSYHLLFCVLNACGRILKFDRKKSKKHSISWGICKFKTAEDAARSIRVLRNCSFLDKKIIIEPHDDESITAIKELHNIYKGILISLLNTFQKF